MARKVVAAIGLGTMFVLTASVARPRTSEAGPATPAAPTVETARPAPADSERPKEERDAGKVLGRLRGREHEVVIYADHPEPVCAVLTRQGEVVARGLSTGEVASRFADLSPLLEARADASQRAEALPRHAAEPFSRP